MPANNSNINTEEDIKKKITSLLLSLDSCTRLANGSPKLKRDKDNDRLIVYIGIYLLFGVNIHQFCYEAQTLIKTLIEDETDFTVKEVNLDVEGIDDIK